MRVPGLVELGVKEVVGGSIGGCDMYQLHISYSITHRFRWDTWVTEHTGDAAHG